MNGLGEEINLTDFNKYGITNWSGLSDVSVNIQTQQIPFVDGSVYLDSLLNNRTLDFTLAINDNGNLETRYSRKRELISILNPKTGEGYLHYTNNFISKRIKVVPDIPKFNNKNISDAGTLKAMLSFTACSPYWEDEEETVVTFNSSASQTVMNNGDVPTNPVIKIVGEDCVNPKLQNDSTGSKLQFAGTISVPLNINTNMGIKTAYTEELSFTDVSVADDVKILDVCYSEALEKYVAIGHSVANPSTKWYSCTSSDGETWNVFEQETAASYRTMNCVCYANAKGLFYAGGYDGYVMSSADGETWETAGQPLASESPYSIYSIAFNEATEDFYMSVGGGDIYTRYPDDDSYLVAASHDLSGSYNAVSFFDRPLNSIKKAGKFFYTTARYGTPILYYATEDTAWTNSWSTISFEDFAVDDNSVPSEGVLMYNPDGFYIYHTGSYVFKSVDDLATFEKVAVLPIEDTNYDRADVIAGQWIGPEAMFIVFYYNNYSHDIWYETSADGITWTDPIKICDWETNHASYDEYFFTLFYSYMTGSASLIGYDIEDNMYVTTDLELKQNQIQNLSNDSDMDFNLQKGGNQITLYRKSGDATITLSYRQKYIGV